MTLWLSAGAAGMVFVHWALSSVTALTPGWGEQAGHTRPGTVLFLPLVAVQSMTD